MEAEENNLVKIAKCSDNENQIWAIKPHKGLERSYIDNDEKKQSLLAQHHAYLEGINNERMTPYYKKLKESIVITCKCVVIQLYYLRSLAD